MTGVPWRSHIVGLLHEVGRAGVQARPEFGMTKESYTEAVLAGIDAALQAQVCLTMTASCTASSLNTPLEQIDCGNNPAVCCATTCSSTEVSICPAAPCDCKWL